MKWQIRPRIKIEVKNRKLKTTNQPSLLLFFRNSFPVYFLALKKLLTDWSRERLQEAFDESDVKLLDLLPEPEKNESVLVKVLAEHELSFLMPLLSLKDDMESQLVSADATAFAAWIGEIMFWIFPTVC